MSLTQIKYVVRTFIVSLKQMTEEENFFILNFITDYYFIV